MQPDSNTPNQSELIRLQDSVTKSVEMQLRQTVNVAPMFMASTPSGLLFVPGTKVDDEAENKRYAKTIRLSCIAAGASASILCVKCALVDSRSNAQFDGLSIPKPSRREGISLFKEALNRSGVTMFVPILRDESGRFTGFGTAETIHAGPPKGLSGKLLPDGTPTNEQRYHARLALRARRLHIWPINQDSSPSWN